MSVFNPVPARLLLSHDESLVPISFPKEREKKLGRIRSPSPHLGVGGLEGPPRSEWVSSEHFSGRLRLVRLSWLAWLRHLYRALSITRGSEIFSEISSNLVLHLPFPCWSSLGVLLNSNRSRCMGFTREWCVIVSKQAHVRVQRVVSPFFFGGVQPGAS